MNIDEIKASIKENYGLDVIECKKIKNIYRIRAEHGEYCLKIIKYQYPHFYFILSAILYLQKQGFSKVPEIIDTVTGDKYIKLEGLYAYLTPWVISRESNYDNPIDLMRAAEKLSELHVCSEGFTLNKDMKPRIGWFTWINVFETRINEIMDFKKRIGQKAYNSEFDKLYLSLIKEEVKRALASIEHLKESNYVTVMEKEVLKRGFCHHDYAHHNVLVDSNNEISIIDFDYCILDTHLHDLSSLMIRAMKDGKWDLDKAAFIIEAYEANKKILDEEIPIMSAFIEFPQQFWQIGLQYYWEQQPWEEEFFIKKLMKYSEDRAERQEFVNQFRASL